MAADPKNILIVSATPEPLSFGGALERALQSDLHSAGYQVTCSNLYQQHFNAVAFPEDFTARQNDVYFDMNSELGHAFANATTPDAVKVEQQRVLDAALVLFVTPLYWGGPPAIMRGWFEQVFIPGFGHGKGQTFANGLLKGRTAQFIATYGVGAETPEKADENAAAYFKHLEDRPLSYCGFDVLPTIVMHRHPGHDIHQKTVDARVTAANIIQKLNLG